MLQRKAKVRPEERGVNYQLRSVNAWLSVSANRQIGKSANRQIGKSANRQIGKSANR